MSRLGAVRFFGFVTSKIVLLQRPRSAVAIWHVKVRKTRNAVAIWQGPQNLLPEARLLYSGLVLALRGVPPMTDLAGSWHLKNEKPIVPWPSGT